MNLQIKNLTKHYGKTCALDNLSLDLKPGVYGLLGPNGAGKSTLMGLLTDTVRREAGTICWDGQVLSGCFGLYAPATGLF